MDILPSIKNSGFLTKRVQVTYPKLETQLQKVGLLPAPNGLAAALPDGFVSSTLEKPVLQPGYESFPVFEKNPVLDANGRPVLKTVTETLEVPGPKAEALGDLAVCTVLGGLIGAAPALPAAAIGLLATLIGGSNPNQLMQAGFAGMAIGGALGAAFGLTVGIKEAAPKFRQTNTLNWAPTDVTVKKMTGYNVSQKPYTAPRAYSQFKPRLEDNVVGQWTKPVFAEIAN